MVEWLWPPTGNHCPLDSVSSNHTHSQNKFGSSNFSEMPGFIFNSDNGCFRDTSVSVNKKEKVVTTISLFLRY